MTELVRGPTGFWPTVRLLLLAARRRAAARGSRQRQLLGQKGGSSASSVLGTLGAVVAGGIAHVLVAFLLNQGLELSQQAEAEAAGRILVSPRCLRAFEEIEHVAEGQRSSGQPSPPVTDEALRDLFRGDCILMRFGERGDHWDRWLAHYRLFGRAGFVERRFDRGLAQPGVKLGGLAALIGSLVVVGWFLMLSLEGEGLGIDVQRRRHPMWEWLLSHPVDARAVFLAEMLSPLSANTMVLAGSVFWIGAFGIAYDSKGIGLLAGLAAGVPLSVAAGCVSKAVETVALLRLSPRSRGAALGILSWLGLATMAVMVFAAVTPAVLLAALRWLVPIAGDHSWPLLGWALGLGEAPSPWKGVLACWLAAAAVIALSVVVSARATRRGLAGGFGGVPDAPRALAEPRRTLLGRDPLYRKELLWLWRDRGAVIQVFLMPLTIAALQLINLRDALVAASQQWHLMAGAIVTFGSYFLWILGPRSLVSEGGALWMALTWPRGLEDLLKAKARLWWLVSCIVVGPLLLVTALRFPADAWKVGLVAVVWAAFGRSLAEKAVTLVSAPTASGEPEPIPRGRRWAASLGVFTFAAGVLSRQWAVAFTGLVYSWLTAAAMWENLRARLPHLFDPWSERLPPAPTLTHAMVAISAMLEVATVVMGIVILAFGLADVWAARVVAYAVLALGTWGVTSNFLDDRGVRQRDVWFWERPAGAPRDRTGEWVGLGLGLALGALGLGYLRLIELLPEWGAPFRAGSEYLALHPGARGWLAFMAVAIAPVAEEYLFRGLLFRALDREWGGWRAVWGSACFFAIWHPPGAWPPVALVGAVNAWLFRRSARLLPCVLLHMAYNAVVMLAS